MLTLPVLDEEWPPPSARLPLQHFHKGHTMTALSTTAWVENDLGLATILGSSIVSNEDRGLPLPALSNASAGWVTTGAPGGVR